MVWLEGWDSKETDPWLWLPFFPDGWKKSRHVLRYLTTPSASWWDINCEGRTCGLWMQKCTTLAETSCDFLQLFSYASIFLELQWMTPNEVDPMLSISATVKSSIFGRNDGGMLYHIYINRSPNHIILYSTNLHQPKGLITISYQSLARFIWVPRTLQKEVVSLLLIQRCHLVAQLLKGRLC